MMKGIMVYLSKNATGNINISYSSVNVEPLEEDIEVEGVETFYVITDKSDDYISTIHQDLLGTMTKGDLSDGGIFYILYCMEEDLHAHTPEIKKIISKLISQFR